MDSFFSSDAELYQRLRWSYGALKESVQKWIAEGLVKDKWANLLMGMALGSTYLQLFSKKLFIKMRNGCSVIRGSIKISTQFELSGSGSGLHCFSPNVSEATNCLNFTLRHQEFASAHMLCPFERLKM